MVGLKERYRQASYLFHHALKTEVPGLSCAFLKKLINGIIMMAFTRVSVLSYYTQVYYVFIY